MNKSTITRPFPHLEPESSKEQQQQQRRPRSTLAWFALPFFVCILMMATPLARMAGTTIQSTRPTNAIILLSGGWMPLNIGFSGTLHNVEMATHIVFFMLFVAIAFLIYAGAAYTIWRKPAFFSSRATIRWIWLTVIACSVILILTPAMLSHDIFAYSSYGRILAIYHANPYFTPFADFPHDPFYPLDDWKYTPSAYGPIWQALSTLIALLCGNQPATSLVTYQVLGVVLHLCNMFLIIGTLRALNYSERTTVLGALLYAWNPLALLESCFSGHNDVLLITFLLLGLWSFARIERRQAQEAQKFRLHRYLLPLLFLTFAVLIKASAAPMLVLFLVLLARRAFLSVPTRATTRFFLRSWFVALRTICLAGLLSGAIMLLLYGPFWYGRSIQAIIASFTTTPAASSSYGSILRALQDWTLLYGQPTAGLSGYLCSLFLLRSTWDTLNMLVLVISMLSSVFWIWYRPTIRTLALATLAVLGAVLLVTPWFFPWYVTWLVALAAVILPAFEGRLGRALIGGSIAFSASAFCIYLYMRGVPPIGGWVGLACLTTIAPPILAFLLLLCIPSARRQVV
ncbi:MAG TPA: hypothetical protein VL485_25650 [Ktedonobacteraceae bacterium]|nr:hypothetical protein [Ktedonobacteraceae bacterium]